MALAGISLFAKASFCVDVIFDIPLHSNGVPVHVLDANGVAQHVMVKSLNFQSNPLSYVCPEDSLDSIDMPSPVEPCGWEYRIIITCIYGGEVQDKIVLTRLAPPFLGDLSTNGETRTMLCCIRAELLGFPPIQRQRSGQLTFRGLLAFSRVFFLFR